MLDFFNILFHEDRLHKNFKNVMVDFRSAERDLFNQWADGFEDRDGKLVKEFQTTFNSTFWEVYLYACFKEYGFTQDWSRASPDFCLSFEGVEFVLEATTGNAANGKPNEWDVVFSVEEMQRVQRFNNLNKEAIIRLSNAVVGKARKYNDSYKKLDHVVGKPFVLAVAPFEQPYFNLQYDRPIRALLYDYYVDEDAALDNPHLYPNGPPVVNLGVVEKDNGSEVPLGIFADSEMSEISAVVFSCVGTWGKLSSMSNNSSTDAEVFSTWATPPDGVTEKRVGRPVECGERVLDGLQVYHNPYAKNPLPPHVFRGGRVVQHYLDINSGEWVYEGLADALLWRQVYVWPKRAK
ncbi:hypothetical protein HX867_32460 [Pseudomonas gingeri]|uniref:hypothetical protein n=1 Tax=Pseudomonas gingeri TaxID=117681 RepID=UPI0015A1D812|nr:hypothetical protein [Pseudomonas gingeri]NVZ66835.1 hypothetical protein [Pseudomonas gingeri]